MNKTYRTIWNEALGAWVATSELGGGRRKGAQRAAVAVATVLLAVGAVQAQVKFGDNQTTINPGSVIEAESTNRGVLITRVALTDRATWTLNGNQPVEGMVVYNTNATTGANGLQAGMAVWKGGQWVSVDETPYFHVNSSATGNSTLANSGAVGTGSIAVGAGAYAGASGTVANTANIAIGLNARVDDTGGDGIAIGAGARAGGANSANGNTLAIGNAAQATGSDATALGGQTVASGADSLAIGNQGQLRNNRKTEATGTASTAIGIAALSNKNYATALGAGSGAGGGAGVGATAVGAFAAAEGKYAIALGGADDLGTAARVYSDRAIGIGYGVNIQPGAADAVAVGSYAVAQATNATALGSRAQATGSESVAIGHNAQAIGTQSISVGTGNYNQVTLGNGQASGGTTISNVAPGVAGTDAANVDQLNAGVAGANQYTDQKFNQTRADIDRVGKRASAGTAGAMAMANLPQAYIPGKSMLSVGVAGYDGESALALGVSKLSDNGRWVVKFSGTGNSRGKFGVGAGAGFHW